MSIGAKRRLYIRLSWAMLATALLVAVQVGSIGLFSLSYKTAFAAITSANELGALAAIAFLGIVTTPARRRGDLFHVLPAGAAILISASRTALLLLIAFLAVIVIWRVSGNRIRALWRSSRVVAATVVAGAAYAFYNALASADATSLQLRGRPAIWRAAIDTIKASFPFGVGSRSGVAFAKASAAPTIGRYADTAGLFHSVYLDLTAQFGVLGLVVIGIAVWGLAIRFSPEAMARDRSVFIIVVLFGGIRAFVESGDWLLSADLSFGLGLCWILLGSIAVSTRRTGMRGEKRSGRSDIPQHRVP
jgi:O-antigen ligase